jgi:hypothetical protein
MTAVMLVRTNDGSARVIGVCVDPPLLTASVNGANAHVQYPRIPRDSVPRINGALLSYLCPVDHWAMLTHCSDIKLACKTAVNPAQPLKRGSIVARTLRY